MAVSAVTPEEVVSSTTGLYGSHGSRTDSDGSRSCVSASAVAGKSDENEGGGRKAEVDGPEASEAGYCGGGERWRDGCDLSSLVSMGLAATLLLATGLIGSATVVVVVSKLCSGMPASSSTLRRLRGMGPADGRLDSWWSGNVTTVSGSTRWSCSSLERKFSWSVVKTLARRSRLSADSARVSELLQLLCLA